MTASKNKTKTKPKIEKPILEKKKTKGGARDGAGKKPHEPTTEYRKQVEAATGYGLRASDVAVLIGISYDTLLKYYKEELDLGRVKAHAKIGQTIYNKATGGNMTAALFYAKTQMRWVEARPDPVVSNDEEKQAKIAEALKYLADNLPN